MSHKIQRGRSLFTSFQAILKLLVLMLKKAPVPIRVLLWDKTLSMHGKLGIGIRYCIFSSLANSCGNNVYLGRNLTIKNFGNISVGNNVSIHHDCHLNGIGKISIGNNVSIAHHCSILSSNHSWNRTDIPIKDQEIRLAQTIIRDDVWVGCNSTILAGIIINSRAIVAAGAVVTKNVSSDSIIGGVPAKTIKQI